MPALHDTISSIHSAIVDRFGRHPDDLEDLDSPFETMIAALLGRNMATASWKSAIRGLEEAGLLAPDRLADAEIIDIGHASLAKTGGRSLKTLAPLKPFARWFLESGDLTELSTSRLREELAGIKGIGAPGADAILLFALKRPSYPVDRPTFRVMVRHGWLDSDATYEEAREVLTSAADGEDRDATGVLADLASGMEQLGRTYCRAAAPHCDGCPLERFLPEGGPREPND